MRVPHWPTALAVGLSEICDWAAAEAAFSATLATPTQAVTLSLQSAASTCSALLINPPGAASTALSTSRRMSPNVAFVKRAGVAADSTAFTAALCTYLSSFVRRSTNTRGLLDFLLRCRAHAPIPILQSANLPDVCSPCRQETNRDSSPSRCSPKLLVPKIATNELAS